ncbi:DNA polymerase III subunit delta' [Lampropedia puyangensis]|uniref:DNA polymerase III subunit delta n=1 Tax=Lampropedia puyangensis TaxID=1330072 RepID=A0A4S8FCN1_9BURK|nr:DNA polymerase III subunit delta' [Lampropedia puyangensis]THU05300.1 DNA polymerase III subunit delta' [Lampropedia puyangensis]
MATRGSSSTPAVVAPPPMPWLQGQLQALLEQQGHALLLEGPSGLGQFGLAMAWAQALLCEARSLEAALAPACGHCESCHAVHVRTHPDLLVLLPETMQLALGWANTEGETVSDAKRKPSKEIRVEAMRQMITFCQRTDARGRGKVVVVYPAENMNTVTANALLKTLEEPPGNSRFVLATEAAHRLLPTIRSRCHSWKMKWPDEVQIQTWLAQAGRSAEQIAGAMQASGGRPLNAWELLQTGFDLNSWNQLPGQLVRGQAGLLADASASQAIGVLLQLCHDAMAVVAGAAPRYFAQASLAPLFVGLAGADQSSLEQQFQQGGSSPRQRTLERLGQWSAELMQASRSSEHPFSPDLMLTALVDQASQALRVR